jgi:hemerythrin-like domain-containing protein
MEWMDKLKEHLERMEAEGLQALAGVQSEAMLFPDHLKQHLLQNPEPVFAVLRRVKPIWVSLK